MVDNKSIKMTKLLVGEVDSLVSKREITQVASESPNLFRMFTLKIFQGLFRASENNDVVRLSDKIIDNCKTDT